MVWDLPEVKHNSESYGGRHTAKTHAYTYCGAKADEQPTQPSVEHNLMESLTICL